MALKRTLQIEVDFHYIRGYNSNKAAAVHQHAFDQLLSAIGNLEHPDAKIKIDDLRICRMDEGHPPIEYSLPLPLVPLSLTEEVDDQRML